MVGHRGWWHLWDIRDWNPTTSGRQQGFAMPTDCNGLDIYAEKWQAPLACGNAMKDPWWNHTWHLQWPLKSSQVACIEHNKEDFVGWLIPSHTILQKGTDHSQALYHPWERVYKDFWLWFHQQAFYRFRQLVTFESARAHCGKQKPRLLPWIPGSCTGLG